MRLRLVEGGQGPKRSADELELGDDATVLTPIPVAFSEQPAPELDAEADVDLDLDVATVLVRSSQLPSEPVAPSVSPPLFRSSSQSIPPLPAPEFRHSSQSIPPPEFRSAESIPPLPAPEFRSSAESIPPLPAPEVRNSAESIPPVYPPAYPTHPSQAYLAYPPQQIVAAPPSRGRLLLALAMGGVLVAGGLTLGWVLFGNNDDEPIAVVTTTTVPPAPTPAPSPPAPIVAEPPAKEPVKPAVIEPARAEPAVITSLVHPTVVALTSPISGQVASIEVREPREVNPGQTLLGVRGNPVRNARTISLARKVAELESLARQDPTSYQPFLARTRRELALAQRPELVAIKATSPGVFEPRVKIGDKVAAGAPVGATIDPQIWHATAIVSGAAPLASWSCVVATPDARHSAACKILTTEAVAEGGTRVTVEIQASGTEWLKDVSHQPRIIVEPLSPR